MVVPLRLVLSAHTLLSLLFVSLRDPPIVYTEYSIPTMLTITVWVCAAILGLLMLMSLMVLIILRKSPVLVIVSPLFRVVMIFGFLIGVVGAGLIVIPPSNYRCLAIVWLYMLSFALSFGKQSLFGVSFSIFPSCSVVFGI